MARKEDACKIELHAELTQESYSSLHLLYYPLIQDHAMQLYLTMISLASRSQTIKNHLLIAQITGQDMERIEKSRHILEQFLLMKTFYHAVHNAYIYKMFAPKNGQDFLRHEVFGRLYMKKMGEQAYAFMKLSFATQQSSQEGYQDISTPFINVLKDDWQDHEEAQFLELKPSAQGYLQNEIPLRFNFERFLHGFSKTLFPITQRNEKNLRAIAELATIHGIDEMTMRKLVSQSMNVKDNTLHLDRLKKKVRGVAGTWSAAVDEKNPYRVPPVRFLQMKQHGVPVSSADKHVIESLVHDFQLLPEVVNVLIEYVLDKTNQRFTKSYVQKVASVWVRLQIDSADKALTHIAEEQKTYAKASNNTIKALPDWYYDQDVVAQDQTPVNEEALEEMMKQLRGE